MMTYSSKMSKTLTQSLLAILCLEGYILSSNYNYLFFHVIAEDFSIFADKVYHLANEFKTRQIQEFIELYLQE